MSSRDDISLFLYLKTIMEGKNYRKMLIALEMPLDQLFESGAGSTSASLSCLRGYHSNMAPGTVKRSISGFAAKSIARAPTPASYAGYKKHTSSVFTYICMI